MRTQRLARGTHAGGTRTRTPRCMALLMAGALLAAACSNSSDEADPTDAPNTADTSQGNTTAPSDTSNTSAPDNGDLDIGSFEPVSGVPGVSNGAISFAVLGTGAANPVGLCLLDCYAQGVQAYFDYRNSLDGINGRRLELSTIVDDDLVNTKQKALELIDSDVFGVFAATVFQDGYADIAEAGVPLWITMPVASAADGYDNMFVPIGAPCAEDCQYHFAVQEAVIAGATKVGVLGFGASPISRSCVDSITDTFEKWGPDLGIEVVYKNDSLGLGFPNGVGPEVTAMKDAGVDLVQTCIDQNSVLTVLQELRRQGMDDTTVVLPQGYADARFISDNKELLEGALLGVFTRPFESNIEGTAAATFLEWAEKSDVQVNDFAIQGWIAADMAATAILRAGPVFDRQSAVDAFNLLTAYTAGGLIWPVDWTLQHNAPSGTDNLPPQECFTFVRVTDGTFELIGDADKPWWCWDNSATEWQEPTPTDFD